MGRSTIGPAPGANSRGVVAAAVGPRAAVTRPARCTGRDSLLRARCALRHRGVSGPPISRRWLAPSQRTGCDPGRAQELEQQVLRLVAEGRVATLCIHGDDPRAVVNAKLVRTVLANHGIAVRSFMETTADGPPGHRCRVEHDRPGPGPAALSSVGRAAGRAIRPWFGWSGQRPCR